MYSLRIFANSWAPAGDGTMQIRNKTKLSKPAGLILMAILEKREDIVSRSTHDNRNIPIDCSTRISLCTPEFQVCFAKTRNPQSLLTQFDSICVLQAHRSALFGTVNATF